MFGKQTLRGKVTAGRIVLVQSVQRDSFHIRVSRLSQRLTEDIMTLVGNPNPVDGTQDNWFAGSQQDDSASSQRRHDLHHRFNTAIAQRRPQRRRHISLKRRCTQRRVIRCEGLLSEQAD